MTKREFISQYITSFLAAYAVKNYLSCCQSGDFTEIQGSMIEDAEILAIDTWDNELVRETLEKYS